MHWYYSKEHTDLKTPSRADGIDSESELRYRKDGARFIMDLGNKLGLRYLTMATGIVFFHRFYMFQSFKNFPRFVTGTACLFLAGKVEETPKKCKDLLRMCRSFLSESQFESFGENPRRTIYLHYVAPDPLGITDHKNRESTTIKEEVMMLERILLQTIKFDLQVDHPYQYLIKYGKGLKGDKQKINELVQKAWIFINDSLSTCICLHYEPTVVSLAMLNLAAKLSKQSMQNFTPVPRQDWWRHFSPDTEQSVLDDICNEMMDLYEPSRRRSKSREGSVTDSPAYASSSSPAVTGSPPTKKKRSQSSSLADGSKAKDSPLAKPPQVENVSPPVTSKLQSTPSQPPQPAAAVTTQAPQGHYYQRGFKFMGSTPTDAPPQGHDIPPQQQSAPNVVVNAPVMMQNPQTMPVAYNPGISMHAMGIPPQAQVMVSQVPGIPPRVQGIPPHGQVIPSHGQAMSVPNPGMPQHGQLMPPQDQVARGGLEQPPYSYVAPQPQHVCGYPSPQMPHVAPQWKAQPPGMGPGWMK